MLDFCHRSKNDPDQLLAVLKPLEVYVFCKTYLFNLNYYYIDSFCGYNFFSTLGHFKLEHVC